MIGMQRKLLVELVARRPFQPATALWRAVELSHVLASGFPLSGTGLDVGCGDGLVMRLILQQTASRPKMVGIDIDPLEAAAADRVHVYDRVHTCPSERIPEPDASFDFAFSNSVLEHIPDLEGAIREVSRLLKAGGAFVFTVPGPDFHRCLRGPLLAFTSRQEYLDHLDRRVAHLRYPTRAEWAELLGRHGMQVESAEGYFSAKQVRRWEFIAKMTAGVLYTLWGGRKQPIEIQRSLGLREGRRQLVRPLARMAAGLLSVGVVGRSPGGPYGCLMIRARKS
jgi:SAM-dependent methyltransferase